MIFKIYVKYMSKMAMLKYMFCVCMLDLLVVFGNLDFTGISYK